MVVARVAPHQLPLPWSVPPVRSPSARHVSICLLSFSSVKCQLGEGVSTVFTDVDLGPRRVQGT